MRLIDADWVMNALTVYGQSYDYVSVGRVTEVIEDAPAIDAEPVRRGRWVIEPGIGCECSACGFDIGNDLDFMEYVKYCPQCGAKMEENR